MRWLMCMVVCAVLVGGDVAVFAAAPPSSDFDCRVAEHRPKRLRRLSNRFGTKQPAPIVQHDEEATSQNDLIPAPATPASDPVRLNARGGWTQSATMDYSRDDRESAAALFPIQTPADPNE
jgi:hypothetical protein